MSDDAENDQSMAGASSSAEQVIEGMGVASGIAIGDVFRYSAVAPDVNRTHIDADEVETELDLLEDAVQQAHEELEKVRSVAQEKLDPDGKAIFEAQAMMLQDEKVFQSVRQRIREDQESASYALSTVLQEHRQRLAGSDDEYLRERAHDLEELRERLLRALQRGKAAATVEPDSIIVAKRLTAADIIRFSRQGMLGCVMARGGRTSHVSIIARALNLPAIVVPEGAVEALADQDRVIIDGTQGRLITNPSGDTLADYRRRRAEHQSLAEGRDRLADQPAETTDGHRVALRANVEFGETLDNIDGSGAEGIGLMRTEMLFLGGRSGALTEEEQTEVYQQAAKAAGEHGATIRLLDLGGDKLMPFAQKEDNPFLGWRGIRVLLDRTDELLRPQLRALLRANAHGNLRVLLPMVTRLDEVRRVQTILKEEVDRLDAQDEPHDPELSLGVMVEVPAVALQAQAFAEVADFLSLGTNDLTQYVLAVDRGNDLVSSRFDALHPAVLGLLKRTVHAGQDTNTPVALCGEIASDPYAVPILVGIGFDELSAVPSSLPVMKRIITEFALEDARGLADEVCAAPDAETVRDRAQEWMDRHLDLERYEDRNPLTHDSPSLYDDRSNAA